MGSGGGQSHSYGIGTGRIIRTRDSDYQELRATLDRDRQYIKRRIETREKNTQPQVAKRNVFISFHSADEMQVKLLRHQAKDDRFNFSFRDYSVKEPFSEGWKDKVRERIRKSSVVICFIGEHTHSRPAVIWELEEAYRMNKTVIGVRIYRDANHEIPEPLLRNNARIIPWNLGDLNEILSTV